MTPWTIACHVPLSKEFSRQEYRNGLPFPPPGYLPDPAIEHASLSTPALAGRFFTTEPLGKPTIGEMKCRTARVVFMMGKLLLAFLVPMKGYRTEKDFIL